MNKPKVLCILQNAYNFGKRSKMTIPVYPVKLCNRKNATYSRIIPYLEKHFEVWFTECTPIIATNNKDKFETDLSFVKTAIDFYNWDFIFAFGKQAENAIKNLKTDALILPHPTSFNWRKQHFLNLIYAII